MAKTIDMFPKKEGNDPLDEITMDNIAPLIRAAINGDEHAKKVVTEFLDFYEQHREMFDIFGDYCIDRSNVELLRQTTSPMVMKNMIIWVGSALWFSHVETLRSTMSALS